MMGKSTESQRKLSRIAWKIAAVVVTSVSVAWVLWLLMGVWPSVVLHWSEIRPTPLLLGFALALVASYLTFEAFATLVNNLQIAGLPRRELAHLHFTSQLLKHMPGRVWGVGYQWALGGAVGSLGDWLSANLGHMALATFFALWSAAITFGFSLGIVWGVLALVCGGVVYHACWSLVSSPRVTNWLARFSGRIGKLTARIANLFARIPGTVRGRIFLLSVTSWLCYYAAWFMNGLSYPALGPIGGMQLCAFYMVAWFVGYVSLLTPSGLGVRELVFAWLAKDFAGDAVALMAVVGRINLLFVDLFMGLAFAPFAPRRS